MNLEHQIRIHELPWILALDKHRRTSGNTHKHAARTLRRLGGLTLNGFSATVPPNPLITELSALSKQAGLDVVWVEELAADIFMGRFSPKFLWAAQLAGDVLEGSLYERYYGIDYLALRRMKGGFAELCHRRAGLDQDRSWWFAANGMVIEQAQILTTHNLATLVHPIGVEPPGGWDGLARRAFGVTCRLVRRVHANPHPQGTVKDAAFAWRQAIFFLSLCGLKEQISVTAWMQDELDRQPRHTVLRLDPVLAGLRHVLAGGDLDDGHAPPARRLFGWSVTGHWMTA